MLSLFKSKIYNPPKRHNTYYGICGFTQISYVPTAT